MSDLTIKLSPEEAKWFVKFIQTHNYPGMPAFGKIEAALAQLERERDEARAEVERCEKANSALSKALAFAQSAIKSGEKWSEECECIITTAFTANKLYTALTPAKAEDDE